MDISKIIDLVHQTKAIIMDDKLTDTVYTKGVADFVTQVDFAVQDFLFKSLSETYPGIGFMSEEQEENCFCENGAMWILDPIDGTTNLIHHCQHSAVSLGLYRNQCIELGIVYNPFTDETFHAELGRGAFLNGAGIHVSGKDKLKESLITVGTSPYHKEWAGENFDRFRSIFMECPDIRISGSAALDISYIAAGRFEAYFEKDLKPWDYAASSLILTEAGGRISSWDNSQIIFHNNCNIVADNGLIHESVRKHLMR